jgi:TPR repeat protein
MNGKARFAALTVFGALLFCAGMVQQLAWAAPAQPIVLSRKCPTGGAEGEKLFREAQDYENARNGAEPDFFKAERLYEQALIKGNAPSALYLGRMYRQSFSEVPSHSPRLRFQVALFEQAISMGCPDGYLFLAEAYQNGWGARAGMAAVWQLVKTGAEKGSMAAMTAWGANLYFENRYEKGVQAEVRRAEAKDWLEKALKQGYGEAGHELAIIYRMYEQDPENAIRVLREGGRLGNAACLYMLAGIYRRGEDGQPQDLDYAEMADTLRRNIDLTQIPTPISHFSEWLPPRQVLPYRVQTP